MTGSHPEGGRAGGAVPPLLLVVGGLLLTLVAVVALVLQLRAGGPSALGPTRPPVATSTPSPTTTQAPSTTTQAPSTTTSEHATTTTRDAPTTPSSAPPTAAGSGTAATGDSAAAPSWITIGAAGVDGPIVPQGLSADGTINPGREEVIWFTGAGRVAPGEVGTAVIAGHVTWEGAPDAFVDLPSVRVGDVVTVGYDDGTSRSFTVTGTAAVDKDQLARSLTVWGPHPDRPRLAIITCDPVLGYQADGHTSANYVVVAEG